MKRSEIILVLISTTVIVFAWVAFSVYHNFITSTIPETVNTNIQPINPNFDTQTIDELKKRKKTTPLFQIQNTSITPTPSISTQTNNATSSGESTSVINDLPIKSP